MDTTDPDIVFDNEGVCNHCHAYDLLTKEHYLGGESGKHKLGEIVKKIKQAGTERDYDCIIGVSGGVDSSYVAYLVKELGLRPLAVHLDNGWDSELAVKNIEQLLKFLGIELYTHVIDWEEFKDLQLAFLKASTPDSEIPSDHAIVSLMRHIARERNIQYILSGCNLRTETHIPRAWSQGHGDWKYINSIHSLFGTVEIKTYPHTNLTDQFRYWATQHWVDILNYVDYVKRDAKRLLREKFCWKDYGGKHHESIYTRFYQGYILPKKFGYDKRRAHYSSLICSREMARTEALEELKQEPYPVELQKQDRDYLLKKFNLTNGEFEEIMNLPKRSYWDYPSYGKSFYQNPLFKVANAIRRRTKSFIKQHSSR
jgi:N-acetyl sugar amidotransferase